MGGLLFLLAAAVAWQRLPERPHEVRAGWLVLAAILSVGAIWVNAAEFRVSAWLVDREATWLNAFRISCLGSAANILPIPGAVVVRTRGLLQLGESARGALSLTTGIGVAWVGAAAFLAGVLVIAVGGRLVFGTVLLIVGVLAAILTSALLRFGGGRLSAAQVSTIACVEFLSVVLSGARLYAVARLADFEVGFVDAIVVNLGAILSHVAGIFPGGLGLREIMSGVFAGLAGVAPSAGVLMAVFDRILMYVVLSLVVGLLFLWDRLHPGADLSTCLRGDRS